MPGKQRTAGQRAAVLFLPIRAFAAERLGFTAPCRRRTFRVPQSVQGGAMTDRTQSLAADRRGERRRIRVGLLIAAALMLSLVFFSTSARAAEADPTIVLVHGAFASPAGWDGGAAALHKDGYQTAAPALVL